MPPAFSQPSGCPSPPSLGCWTDLSVAGSACWAGLLSSGQLFSTSSLASADDFWRDQTHQLILCFQKCLSPPMSQKLGFPAGEPRVQSEPGDGRCPLGFGHKREPRCYPAVCCLGPAGSRLDRGASLQGDPRALSRGAGPRACGLFSPSPAFVHHQEVSVLFSKRRRAHGAGM